MKVLWITFFAPWTLPMLKAIQTRCDIEVIVPSEGKESYHIEDKEGIRFHHLVFKRNHGVFCTMDEGIANKYLEIIKQVHPDIIHIQGTEKNLGQIQNFVKDIPVVINIQGILSGCLPYNTAFIKEKEIRPYRSLKNWLGHQGLYASDRACERGINNYENEILANARYIMGRTKWDHARTLFANPNSHYFECEELLRPSFYENAGKWNVLKCKRHSFMMPAGFNPLKGMHIAIKAASLLKKIYPDVVLKIPAIPMNILNRNGLKEKLFGEELLTYCKNIIRRNNIENNVVFLPRLNEEEMVREMLSSNVFLSCSSIDNSSNAVGEATMLGVPLVVTAVGGLISFMHDEQNCLLSASGDEYMIAYQIRRLFEDDELCNQLSIAELNTARKRHDIQRAAELAFQGYQRIIELHKQAT